MREAVTATVVWVKVAELDIGSYHRWGWCVSPKIVEISRILKGRNRPAVTDFSYSETDRGFGRVAVRATRRRAACPCWWSLRLWIDGAEDGDADPGSVDVSPAVGGFDPGSGSQ